VCEPFPFTANEKTVAREAADSDYKIKLTDEEESRRKATSDKNKAELNARRSQSYLESGKVLLKKKNYSSARKQFEKCIAESPDSEAAKEASELIEKLP
jgi:TolA-binding protein